MSKHDESTISLTRIALSVAALIAGGGCIFFFSRMVPVPGMKYLLMSPYLALVMAIVMKKIRTRFVIMKINAVFGLIMSMITIYMGLAIFLTGVLAQLVFFLIPEDFKYRIQFVAGSYSGFTVASALLVSKFFIGGPVFEAISPVWILSAAVLGFGMGILGSIPGLQVAMRLRQS